MIIIEVANFKEKDFRDQEGETGTILRFSQWILSMREVELWLPS